MKKTSNSGEPGPRKIDVYGSLQAKSIPVGLALVLTLIFGPIRVGLGLVTFLAATVFSGGRVVMGGSLWEWLLAVLLCALAVPLYRLESKLMRQLKELREQMG